MWERSSLESADCASSRCNNESAGVVVNRHQPVERLIPVLYRILTKLLVSGMLKTKSYFTNRRRLVIEKMST